MIDLSFLTEAEQEAILKVLNRDAELKQLEEERVKNLQDVVDDENEFKYKSGQWFYDAKSKRHRDKIHGADLVRASIRKRKKPATIAELSEANKNGSKRRWVNSGSQDIFIPPALYGVMEAPDEAEEDIKLPKQEGNQSSSEKEKDSLRNGTLSPPKPRQNPFNSEGLQGEKMYNNEAQSPNPETVQMNGTEKPKSDIMSSLAKYGVKLPYPEPSTATLNSPRTQDGDHSQEDVQLPLPKPRTLRMNDQPQERSNSMLKRDDSFNSTGKRRGILKRRSSTSSTDSESLRISQSVETNKIVLPGSPIQEAGQNNYFEQDETSDNDRLKQVRFSEKIQQRPPSPYPESYGSREVGEYGILDPGLSVSDLDNRLEDRNNSKDSIVDRDPSPPTASLSTALEQNVSLENQDVSLIKQPLSLKVERSRVTPKEDLSKMNDTLMLEAITDKTIEASSNNSSDKEPLYAVVKKTPAAASCPSQEQDFDLDDALMKPRFHDQRGKTQIIYLNEKPVEFGKSFSGGGKMTLESNYPSKKHKESYSSSSEEERTPDRAKNTESFNSSRTENFMPIIQGSDDPVESVARWRRPFIVENQEPRLPSQDLTKEKKTSKLPESPGVDLKAKDLFGKTQPENQPSLETVPGEYKKEIKYKSVFLQNSFDTEHKPVRLTTNLPVAQNVSELSNTSGPLDKPLPYENKGRKDLPKSAHFNVMSLKARMNEMPREQMSNPSQFQSLKHFWNVEENNLPRETAVTSPDKILMHVSSRKKPTGTDFKQSSLEMTADEVMLPTTLDSLSEEEQTSQKVASWLAQTQTVYGVSQMDQNERPLYSGEEIVEPVQRTTIHKKPDEEFTSALQKLGEEAVEAPDLSERSRAEKAEVVPQGKFELVDHKQKTIPVFPISQNSIETKDSATDLVTTDRGFYERIVQINHKRSPAKDALSVEPKNKPFEENIDDMVPPETSVSDIRIDSEKPNDAISDKEMQKESHLASEESEVEEVMEKSKAPKSRAEQDFILALKKLEIEASKEPPLPDVELQDALPKEELKQKAVSPVKSSIEMSFEHFDSAKDSNKFKTPTNETVESQPQSSYAPSKEAGTDDTGDSEETIEKSTVPSRKDNEDLSIGLKKLELEEIEPQSNEEYVADLNQEVAFKKPENRWPLQTNLSGDHFDINHPYSSNDGESVDNLEQPTKVSSSGLKPISQTGQPDTFDGQGKLPVAEELLEKTRVESQESSADFHNRLMRLEEQAKIPEEPEDLLVNDTVEVSQHPKTEVVVSKKAYSSIESMPKSLENSSESGNVKETDSPRSKPKDLNLSQSHDFSPYDELANYPHSPEPSGSYTGNGNMLYKKPEVGSPKVSDGKPGKPALSGSPSDTTSLKSDKYDFEFMKAQDESISKVLDWFSRSFEVGDNPPPPVGTLQPSKGSSSQLLIQTSANESGPNESNMKTGPTSSPESLNVAEKPKSRLLVISTQSNNDNSDTPCVEHPELVGLIEDDAISPVHRSSSSEDISPLQYGKSAGGSGKMYNKGKNAIHINGQDQQAKYLDIFEEGKEGLGSEEEHKGSLKENIIPVAMESMSNQEMIEKPHSRLSLSSTDTNEESEIKNDELLTQSNSIQNNAFPQRLNSNVETSNCMEFGKSGGGVGKTSSPGSEISDIKKPQPSLSLSSTESTDHDQSDTVNVDLLTPVHLVAEEAVPPEKINLGTENLLEFGKSESQSGTDPTHAESTDTNNDPLDMKNDELLTPSNSLQNNASTPRLINSTLEAGNGLEFGMSGGGSGKTSSPSLEISDMKPHPSLSLSSTESMDRDRLDTVNVDLLTPVHFVEEESVPPEKINLGAENPLEFGENESQSGTVSTPEASADTNNQSDWKNNELMTPSSSLENNASKPRLINSTLEAGDGLEFNKSGGGYGETTFPSQKIFEIKKPQPSLSLSSTESMDHDRSDTANVDLLTPVHVVEEESQKINLGAENPLEFGKSEGGSGKISNQAEGNIETDSQLLEVNDVFDKYEKLKDDRESVDSLKEKFLIPRNLEARTLSNDTEKGQLDGAESQKLEHTDMWKDSASQGTVKLNVPQGKVSDLKLLWEGDKSTLPEAKTKVFSGSKWTVSPKEISITPRSSSVESDDRHSPSLVTFKKVMVEEDDENLLPIDQLKSFWENEKNKDVVNVKLPDNSAAQHVSLDADISALPETIPKFKKRHTIHAFFEKEQSLSTDKIPPGRSVSLTDSANDNLKDRPISTTFQNLRSFWNIDSKAKSSSNSNDQAGSDIKNKLFRSNPDLSKESFVAKIKSKLESQSLEDIREDTPATNQAQAATDMYNRKNKAPLLGTFTKQASNSPSNSVELQENVPVFKDFNPPKVSLSDENWPKSKTPFEVSDKKEASEVVVKSAQKPEKVSEFSLALQKLRDESSNKKSLEGTKSVNFDTDPKNDGLANLYVENQDVTHSQNGNKMNPTERERKPFLVKQIGFDASKFTVDADTWFSPKNSNRSNDSNNADMAQVDDGEPVHEMVERTLFSPPKHSDDFDRGLQKLYEESLEVSPVPDVALSQQNFMNLQSPEENFSKVLTVSSSKNKYNVQRTSSKETSSPFQQPIVISLSSKKMNVGNKDTSSATNQTFPTGKNDVAENLPRSILADPQTETQVLETPTSQQHVTLCEETEASITSEKIIPTEEQDKKEIIEEVEIPTIVPRAPFNYFDEGLKKLYEESKGLTANKSVSDPLQALPAKQDSVITERASSVSQAPDILEQEIEETIEKASEPTKMYHSKSSVQLRRETINDEEKPFIENVLTNHVTSEESQPKFSEEGTVSEMSAEGKQASLEENVDAPPFEKGRIPSEADSSLTDLKYSTPTEEKNNSMHKSTVALYLKAPYHKEISKSMDFELAGYVTSDADKERYQLNSSAPTDDTPAPTVNSFPQNAETLKRLSQSVPTFIQDDICQCTPVLIVCKSVSVTV